MDTLEKNKDFSKKELLEEIEYWKDLAYKHANFLCRYKFCTELKNSTQEGIFHGNS